MTAYHPDPDDLTYAIKTPLATATLSSADNNHKEVPINLTGITSTVFVSVQVHVDTTVPPSLYDDFVVTRLLNKSANFTFVASFGFSS